MTRRPRTASALGRPWSEIVATLGLDPDGNVARALASRDTWSGITVSFPADDSTVRIEAELSGLPVFDRDRNLRGYRGFGVCRDVRIDELLRQRAAPSSFTSTPPRVEPPVFREPAFREEPPQPERNVVPFPAAPAEPTPRLSAVERKAPRGPGAAMAVGVVREAHRVEEVGGAEQIGPGVGSAPLPQQRPAVIADLGGYAVAVADRLVDRHRLSQTGVGCRLIPTQQRNPAFRRPAVGLAEAVADGADGLESAVVVVECVVELLAELEHVADGLEGVGLAAAAEARLF